MANEPSLAELDRRIAAREAAIAHRLKEGDSFHPGCQICEQLKAYVDELTRGSRGE